LSKFSEVILLRLVTFGMNAGLFILNSWWRGIESLRLISFSTILLFVSGPVDGIGSGWVRGYYYTLLSYKDSDFIKDHFNSLSLVSLVVFSDYSDFCSTLTIRLRRSWICL